MNIQDLKRSLKHPQVDVQRTALNVIGLVDETTLYDAVGACYQASSDAQVKAMATWAGKRLHAARQRDFNTIDAIFAYFGIERELASQDSEAEARLIRQLETQMQNELIKGSQDASSKRLMMSAGMAAMGGLVGGSALGGAMLTGGMAAGADMASSNISGQRVGGMSTSRTPAPRPSDMDISVWVKRLRSDPNPDRRRTAAVELAGMNNARALPHFAAAFLSEQIGAVQVAIEQYGKVLYWKQVYWQLSESGALDNIIERRQDMRTPADAAPSAAAQPGTAPLPEVDKQAEIARILKQAAAKKKARGRKRR